MRAPWRATARTRASGSGELRTRTPAGHTTSNCGGGYRAGTPVYAPDPRALASTSSPAAAAALEQAKSMSVLVVMHSYDKTTIDAFLTCPITSGGARSRRACGSLRAASFPTLAARCAHLISSASSSSKVDFGSSDKCRGVTRICGARQSVSSTQAASLEHDLLPSTSCALHAWTAAPCARG
eukprot:scaffold59565_cov23-Tisochrysis_lutea.AAC.2